MRSPAGAPGPGGALARVWLAAAALVAGALSGYAGLTTSAGLIAAAVSGCALLCRRRPGFRLLALATLVFAFGALSVAARSAENPVLEALAHKVPRCELRGRILEQAGGLGTLIAVEEANCEGLAQVRDAGVVVAEIPPADAGARLDAVGWLIPLGDDSFDRARRRLGAQASLIPAEFELGRVEGALHTGAARLRSSLRSATASMDRDRAALLRGLAIGDTSEMSAALESELRRAGLSHLVAVSGTNVAIVLAVLIGLVRRLGVGVRLIVGLCGLVVYVAVVGPEPSVLRAAAMGGIALAAVVSGRRAEPLNALGLALIAVLAVRPALVFSVGLHLSAAATAGIVLWTEPLELAMRRLPRVVRMPLAATAAAQFAVAPVLLLTFGELSVVALPANLLCAPVVAPATVVSLLAAAAGVPSPWLGGAVAGLASPCGAWIIGVGHRLGGPGWASVQLPRELGWPLLAIVVLTALSGVWRGRPYDSDYGASHAERRSFAMTHPVYVLAGEEFLVDEALDRVRSEGGTDPLSEAVFDSEAPAPELLTALGTPSLLGGRRLVVIKDAHALVKEQVDALAGYLESPSPHSVLVLVSSGRTKLDALARKTGALVTLEAPKGRRLMVWIRERATAHQLKLDDRACWALIDVVGNELRDLDAALAQMSSAIGSGARATSSDVKRLFPRLADQRIYAFTDAVGDRRLPAAMAALKRLLDQGDEPLMVLGGLTAHVRRLLRARRHADSGSAAVADVLGLPGWRAERLAKQARTYTEDELIDAMQVLAATDVEMKGGDVPPAAALEGAVVRIVK